MRTETLDFRYTVYMYILPMITTDKVVYGMGLSYRPVRLDRLAGRYENPMPLVDFIPQ
jgi:hypothetical protein